MKLRHIYFLLLITGIALPYWQITPWFLENGLNVQKFFAELFANRVSGSFGMDIFVSTTVLLIFAWFETARLKMSKLIFIAALLGTFGAGVSCGFPLFLYLRQRHIDDLLMDYPITPAVRFLRERRIEFAPRLFEYVERGGTKHSAEVLNIDEHAVVKTLIFETNERKPLIVLQHGDVQVSTKELARILTVKTVTPASPEQANKLTGYLVGGTSPFGVKTKMPVYAEATIFDLERIYINGGKRGFLIEIEPKVLEQVLGIHKVAVATKDG